MEFDRITQSPGVMGGKVCVRRMRVTVGMIVRQIGTGRLARDRAFGFMERPDIPAVVRKAHAKGCTLDPEDVTYYVGHETVIRRDDRKGLPHRIECKHIRLFSAGFEGARLAVSCSLLTREDWEEARQNRAYQACESSSSTEDQPELQ